MAFHPLTAPELYARTLGGCCTGPDRCHWCGSPCQRVNRHDDAPSVIGVKNHWAKCPNNQYVCDGCWRFRRKRVTLSHLAGGYVDAKCPMHYSWYVTQVSASALRLSEPKERKALYKELLKPPGVFFLALLSDEKVNHVQMTGVNVFSEIRGDTRLGYTLDNRPMGYTVYELEEALRNGPEGKEPGVQALVRLLGPHELPPLDDEQQPRGRGRPVKKEDAVANPSRKLVGRD